ncbi:MAG: HutD-family protein [Solimicrobium sp.]|nr:HutD-family protein [Solimicrobium sp.]
MQPVAHSPLVRQIGSEQSSVKKRTLSDYRSMPWKNGAGTTVEIAVFPAQAKLDNFDWRVSRAQVVSDGDFSRFFGVDRSLALLHGVAVQLTTDDVVLQVNGENNIATFSGDAMTHAELMDGAIEDLNVMSRRSNCSHLLTHWEGEGTWQFPSNTVLLYCAQGSGKVLTENVTLDLQKDESVQFSSEHEASKCTLHSDRNSRFYCVQIRRNGA